MTPTSSNTIPVCNAQDRVGRDRTAEGDIRPIRRAECVLWRSGAFGLGYSTADIDRIVGERRKREAREMAASTPRKRLRAKRSGKAKG